MDHQFCPGSRLMKQPVPEFFDCPNCGDEVEIWTDELKRACSSCGTEVMREGYMSCLEWCAKAKECVGDKAYDEFVGNRIISIRHQLLDALKAEHGEESATVSVAQRVLHHAAEIAKRIEVDWYIVLPASILVGQSAAWVREKLLKTGLVIEDVDAISNIVSETSGDDNSPQTTNAMVVHDAAIVAASERDGAGNRSALLETLITSEAREYAEVADSVK